jgi:hypothetical protein
MMGGLRNARYAGDAETTDPQSGRGGDLVHLAAFLWWRAAGQVNAQPSFVAFSRRGVPLAVFAILIALGATIVLPTAL